LISLGVLPLVIKMRRTAMTRDRSLPLAFIASAVLFAGASIAQAAADTAMVQQGEQLFNQNCVFCHQADAIGKPGLAPSLTNKELLASVSDKYLLSTIRDGREGTGMAPYPHLGRDKIKALVAYLRSFEVLPNRAAEIDAQPEAHGDPRLGQQWFEQICSTCHGPEGDGYIAGGSGTAIGKPGFLQKASDGLIRETIRKGRSNTRMLPFQGPEGLANLNDQEIDDIISYLRTLNR
jgi:cytochrome c oxidase cbb3-type subunit 3